jgi:hypothetical protein
MVPTKSARGNDHLDGLLERGYKRIGTSLVGFPNDIDAK